MRKLLLLVWLPFIIFLFPLPPEAAKQMVGEIARVGKIADEQFHAPIASTQTPQPPVFSQAEMDVMIHGLWIVWVKRFGMMMLGLFVGISAWRNRRHWPLLALIMSLFYLSLFILRYVMFDRVVPAGDLFFRTSSTVVNILQLNIRIIGIDISNGFIVQSFWVLYNEFLMPIFQVIVLVWLINSKPRADCQG